MEPTPLPRIYYERDAIPKIFAIVGDFIEYTFKVEIPLPINGDRYIVARLFSTTHPSNAVAKGVRLLDNELERVERRGIMYSCHTIKLRYTFEDSGELGAEISLSHDEEGENLTNGIRLPDIRVDSPPFLEPPVTTPNINPVILTTF
ncbi:hypothetical protein EMCG_07394 [[Emmonsia] crescens]|uniref:Uncharacterized protein n=1 Tax=[Emmonsia] crescens TaxID=73230 RepID=A0A0G2I8S7_9EURO|nr:hypothetical protein EMCG_07394 [Emmonsia crescens UAMH 3008]